MFDVILTLVADFVVELIWRRGWDHDQPPCRLEIIPPHLAVLCIPAQNGLFLTELVEFLFLASRWRILM